METEKLDCIVYKFVFFNMFLSNSSLVDFIIVLLRCNTIILRIGMSDKLVLLRCNTVILLWGLQLYYYVVILLRCSIITL